MPTSWRIKPSTSIFHSGNGRTDDRRRSRSSEESPGSTGQDARGGLFRRAQREAPQRVTESATESRPPNALGHGKGERVG